MAQALGDPVLYPEVQPSQHGMLDVGDRNFVYWEICGIPAGKPAVVFHGGPGSGCVPSWRRYFNPAVYRVVLFDQRGCGRSTPHAGHPAVDLAANTTEHLIADIERLREQIGIERWLVVGGSWGSTLALAYAERFPERVSEMVLFSVVTTSRREVRWATRDVGRYFPEEWARFQAGVPATERDGDLVAAYYGLLHDPDPAVREKAARDWCRWEDTHVAVRSDHRPDPRYNDPSFRIAFARLVTHYWHHVGFLEDGALLRDAGRLAGIPGVVIHGRLDLSSPLDVPQQLSQVWPGSDLIVIDDAGHGTGQPGILEGVDDRHRPVRTGAAIIAAMSAPRKHLAVLLSAFVATVVAACGSTPQARTPPAPGQVIWAAPSNPLELTVSAGLQPEVKETLHFHVHAHLDVFIDGQAVLVPAGIGINITDPAVQQGQWNGDSTYGGIAGCSQPCISPLHTHDESGVIHTESANSTPNRLGQFFTEWNVPISGRCVGEYCAPATAIVVYVDGRRYSGNPADISLTDRKEIVVVIGPAPKQIPSSFPSWAPG